MIILYEDERYSFGQTHFQDRATVCAVLIARTRPFVLQRGQPDNRLLPGDPERTFHGLRRVQVHNQQQRRRGYHVGGSRLRARSVRSLIFSFSRIFRTRRH